MVSPKLFRHDLIETYKSKGRLDRRTNDRHRICLYSALHNSLIITDRSPWEARQGEKARLVEEEANRHLHNCHHHKTGAGAAANDTCAVVEVVVVVAMAALP